MAPIFHEQWTGPVKISKIISDVTYEVHDLSINSQNIVHFDRLRKAAIKPCRHVLSESEPVELITNESEIHTLSPAPETRQVHKPTAQNAPNPAEKEAKTLRPQTTEIAERIVKDRALGARSPVRVFHRFT